MFLGVQIVSIAVLLCIIIGFSGLRKLPILSTKWYERFLLAALFNFIFEIFSLLTLYEKLPSEWNRLSHQLFFVSLVGVLHCFLLFIDIKGRNQKRYTLKELIARSAPFWFTIPVILFGELEYYVDGMMRYSQGSMVIGISVIAGVYILSYVLLVYHFRSVLSQREIATFIYVFVSISIITLIQLFVPFLLMTSMSVALMAMNVFMTFENPREHADLEVLHALNKNAFLTMVNEYIQSKQEFYVVSMTLTNSQILKEAKGYNATVAYMEDAALYLQKYADTSLIYHPKRDWVCLMFADEKQYCAFIEEQKELFQQEGHNEHGSAKFMMSVLKCPEFAGSADEVVKVLDYVDKIKSEIKDKILSIDEMILDEKNHLAEIEAVVQKAIDNDGFDVYYQPIYSNSKKAFVSAEALVRLKDTETLGFISPEVFIPIAEENGMIREVGNIVFRKVCKFVSENNLASYGIQYVEVNLSGAQFMDDKLNEILSSYVKEYNVPPEFINLEITETASIEAAAMLEYNMHRLKECRFKFSMDDFGTGYSNLAKIAQSDFDLIKLDKSLLWPCFGEQGQEEARIILESSVDMILKLGKSIVAEGVETQEQVDYLTEQGVEYLQGYYFSRPLSGDKYLAFMEEHR
ncbi:MAG: EAL domain-containing protein [Agathobacter sp.]|nr:EAL domain-containing protein [Agathobacter sp.]